MADPTFVDLAREGGVATITLRRPEKLNALTDALMLELTAALDAVAADKSVRVVVLSGAGRAFSAGFDVSPKPGEPRQVSGWKQHVETGVAAMRRIWTLPQPVVAKIRGACLGGGFDLALACDLAYASDDAFFGEPEVKFGGGSMFMVLPWLIGLRHVNELLLTGRTFDARRACELGLINEAVPADALDARVAAVVRHMCEVPEGTLPKNKAMTHRIYELMGLLDAIGISADTTTIALSARDGDGNAFDAIAKRDGLAAALTWQKQRFAAIGAFPR